MKLLIKSVVLLLAFSPALSQAGLADKFKEVVNTNYENKSIDIDYGDFQINYSCFHAGYNYAKYNTVPDRGSESRYSPFHLDKSTLKSWCPSQISTKSYYRKKGETQYDRGHGVHQNIWDHSRETMKKTNMMTNIVPQNRKQNRYGLWRKLETRVECARDLKDSAGMSTSTSVFLGNIWGDDKSNDHFRRSHLVTTPDFLWRVHVYPTDPNKAYAWIIPNDANAKLSNEHQYRATMHEIAERAEYPIQFPKGWSDATDTDPHVEIKCSWK